LSSGVLNYAGTVTPAALGALNRTGGEVRITGTLAIGAGNTYTLDAATGSYTLYAGTVSGGTLNATGGSKLQLLGTSGTLADVAIGPGVLDFSAPAAQVVLTGTTTLPAEPINLTTRGSAIVFKQTVTLNNMTINAFGFDTYVSVEGANTLTLGPNVVLDKGDTVNIVAYLGSDLLRDPTRIGRIVNQGLIRAGGTTQSGAGLFVSPDEFTNQGTI